MLKCKWFSGKIILPIWFKAVLILFVCLFFICSYKITRKPLGNFTENLNSGKRVHPLWGGGGDAAVNERLSHRFGSIPFASFFQDLVKVKVRLYKIICQVMYFIISCYCYRSTIIISTSAMRMGVMMLWFWGWMVALIVS